VSVSPRYKEVVESLIDELDRPPAQVLIQVLLAEVTLDNEESFGIDFTLNPIGSLGYGGSYRSAGTGVLTAIGVPNISVSSLDFELLVRALEVQGRLEVLSRPQILVNDNETAEIQVGEEIQLVTDVERLDNGNVRSDVTPRELGVVLNVEPSISPDGFVRLAIAPEISALTTRTTQVSEDFSAPVISQRCADTTVTVKDGQTIVIGGLIQTDSERRVNKVPILGDIPILGVPFRSERVTNTKTELLIILTPRVIFTDNSTYDSEMRRITDEEVDRLTLPENIRESLRQNTVYDVETDAFDEVYDQEEENNNFEMNDAPAPKGDGG
jgi:general secretion pathway protein D